MPALAWRTMPARSISRCETISASAGFSRRVGRKNWDERIWPRWWRLRELTGIRAEFRLTGLACLWRLIEAPVPAGLFQGDDFRVGQGLFLEIDLVAADLDHADQGGRVIQHRIGRNAEF